MQFLRWTVGSAALTLLAAYIGLQLKLGSIAVFWPAAGVAAGLVLITTGTARAGAITGILIGLAIGNYYAGRSLETAVVFLAGNLAQAVAVAALLSRVSPEPFKLDRFRSLALLYVASAVVPALIAVPVAVGLKWSGHTQVSFAEAWWIWFSSHGVGLVTTLPVVLLLRDLRSTAAIRSQAEDLALPAAVAVAAAVVIGVLVPETSIGMLVALLLVLPIGWWMVLRASVARAAISIAIVSVVTIGTTAGSGLFAHSATVAQTFLLLLSAGLLITGIWREREAPRHDDRVLRWPETRELRSLAVLVPLVVFAVMAWWTWRGIVAAGEAVGVLDPALTRAAFLREIVPLGLVTLLGSGAIFMLTRRLEAASAEAEALRADLRHHESLVDAEARLREALAAGRAFTFDYDATADTVRRLDESNILGEGAGPVTAANFFDGIDERDRQRVKAIVASLSPGNPSYRASFRFRRSDGDVLWLEETATAQFDDRGRMVRLRGVANDVTEHKRAEMALVQSEERQRLAAELAGLGVLMIDYVADTAIPDAVSAAQFGLEAGKPARRSLIHSRIHASDRDDFLRRMR